MLGDSVKAVPLTVSAVFLATFRAPLFLFD
jgi:hypothetical protein